MGRRVALTITLALAAVLYAVAASAEAKLDRLGADRLATTPRSVVRDARLASWAKGAPLDEVLWLLRRGPDSVRAAEPYEIPARRGYHSRGAPEHGRPTLR